MKELMKELLKGIFNYEYYEVGARKDFEFDDESKTLFDEISQKIQEINNTK